MTRYRPRCTRRTALRAGVTGLTVAVAGCLGGGGGDGDGLDGEDYPALDRWLTETSVGAADDTYGGRVRDRRGADSVRVRVGAQGNGGNFAYAPSAVAVRPGVTVRWRWTGRGDPHNVEAEPDEQIGESDFEFSSGEAESGQGTEYEFTFEGEGVALYHCEPHLTLGMKGAVVVAER